MSELEQNILRALLSLEESVRSVGKTQPKPDLMAHFRNLDQLTEQLPKETDPTLLHYLRKKSYQKARLWLQGRESENQRGNCRHVE